MATHTLHVHSILFGWSYFYFIQKDVVMLGHTQNRMVISLGVFAGNDLNESWQCSVLYLTDCTCMVSCNINFFLLVLCGSTRHAKYKMTNVNRINTEHRKLCIMVSVIASLPMCTMPTLLSTHTSMLAQAISIMPSCLRGRNAVLC